MANHGFYSDFHDFLSSCSEHYGDLITSALGCYFNHPEEWDCAEDGVGCLQMLTICEILGHNWYKAQFDPVNDPRVQYLAFSIGLSPWFPSSEEVL